MSVPGEPHPAPAGSTPPDHPQGATGVRTDADWHRLAESPSFRRLLHAKRLFIVPAMIFFVVYYFALPVSVAWFPALMEIRVWGALNLAYLFALSQFFMAWIVAAMYIRAAARFDKMAAEVIANEKP